MHESQETADPEHVTQVLSQALQVVPSKKKPGAQPVQFEVVSPHPVHPLSQVLTHVLSVLFKWRPVLQEVQVVALPVQVAQLGSQSLQTVPFKKSPALQDVH